MHFSCEFYYSLMDILNFVLNAIILPEAKRWASSASLGQTLCFPKDPPTIGLTLFSSTNWSCTSQGMVSRQHGAARAPNPYRKQQASGLLEAKRWASAASFGQTLCFPKDPPTIGLTLFSSTNWSCSSHVIVSRQHGAARAPNPYRKQQASGLLLVPKD